MENRSLNGLEVFPEKGQGKNTENAVKKLSPNFHDLTPQTILTHVRELKKGNGTPQHREILTRLLEQAEPVDFELQAFPNRAHLQQQLENPKLRKPERDEILDQLKRFKLTARHHVVLVVETVINIAKANNWGLCKHNEFVYVYNGAYWSEVEKDTLQQFLGEAAEKMGVTKYSAKYYEFREKLLKQFLSNAHLPTPEPDAEKVLINLMNGTYEFNGKNGCLRPCNPGDFLTYQLPFCYDPQAKAPLFEAYLNRVLPDPERQHVLAEYLGSVFIRHGSNQLKTEKALMLYGTGANGKSVFFEIVNALLGNENVSGFSLQSLTDEAGYYRAKIANKLVNYASEINGKLEASIFKQLVSGEPVSARLPYGQPMTLRQYAKLIFNTNELPREVEQTNAFFRRFLIIPFDKTIPEKEQDRELHTKIIASELSGVFNWVIAGLTRLLDQKDFSHCQAAIQALDQYRKESDSVLMFLDEEGYQASSTCEIPLKDMFSEYRAYCIENRFRAASMKTFADRLRTAGYQTERKNFGRIVCAEKKILS